MNLFTQNTFIAGMNAQFARVNTPEGAYPLLLNGRSNKGTISPIKKHVLQTGLPAGNYQALVALGDYLLVVISGEAYVRNVTLGTPWTTITGFSPLNADSEIYTTVLPVGNDRTNYVSGAPVYNSGIAATLQCLRLSDNINQARLIYFDGTTAVAATYANWTKDRPQYVPVGSFSCISGVRHFMASPDGTQIYASRSGRPLDFVLVLDAAGEKAADAKGLATSVDFNPMTQMVPSSDGGVIASTLRATYTVFEDPNDEFFGEYRLKSKMLFPVGCVNWKSTADILGDSAFISQFGIQSFNTVLQAQRESNNYPLGARIARYLSNPQSDTCAINFDTLALFAVNTIYGEAVMVFDTTTQQFVSIDTGFGKVRQFAVHTTSNSTRLWFINYDNQLYEAYADTEYAQCSVLLGDYAIKEPGLDHVIYRAEATFVNLTEAVDVRMQLYAEESLVVSADYTIGSDALISPPAPVALPFANGPRSEHCICTVDSKKRTQSTSLWIQWQGGAELAQVQLDGSTQESQVTTGVPQATNRQTYAFIGGVALNTDSQTGAAMDELTTVVGDYYFIDGTANTGAQTVVDGIFKAIGTTTRATGRLSNVTSARMLRQLVNSLDADLILSTGNLCYPSGTEADYLRAANFWTDLLLPSGLAGTVELTTDSGEAWYSRNQRYYPIYDTNGTVDFFLFSATDIDGVSATSTQGQDLLTKLQLSTSKFKVLVVNKPLYSDTSTGDLTTIQWLRQYFDLVICGGSARYERFYVEGTTIINAAVGTITPAALSRTQTSEFTSDDNGYLKLEADKFGLYVEFIDLDGAIIDATTVTG
jgi:hypothetical protein